MPIAPKSKTIFRTFDKEVIEAALAAAAPPAPPTGVDWKKSVRTTGGGVAETISQLRRVRGKNKKPAKEQSAIRLDPDVLAALRADGPGWQTRVNTVLREWLESRPKSKHRSAAKTPA